MRYQPSRRSASEPFAPLENLEARLVFAADPVTPDNPLWIIPRGAATVDGLLNEPAWDSAGEVFRTQATRADGVVTIRMMWSDSGLFLSADVQDLNIWADGLGSGSGSRWEVEQDDSVTFYFDADQSRDLILQSTDRVFGVNLGSLTDPVNRADGGAVRRWKYVKGDGAGGAPDVIGGGNLAAGMTYASTIRGTVNNPGDQDQGWSVEMFISWSALNMTGAPAHGSTIGMNFDLIQDNDGATRNLTDNRDNPDPNIRYLQPHMIDDFIVGSHSSYHSTQAGLRGPVNYAEAMFIDSRAGQKPATIGDLGVDNVGAFGARLGFTAPAGTTTGQGHVSRYDIRVSTSPITSDTDWINATVVQQTYVPRLRGLVEQLRIAPLTPSTTYYVAVRAIDGAGNLGDISNATSFTTLAGAGPSDKGRIIPSPMGSTLMYENGTPFIPVGDHLGITWGYTRQLFPGDVWDNVNHMYHNFAEDTPAEGAYAPYFDMLQAKGINTMRVFLELQGATYAGNPNPPRGLHWLENNAGQFNPDMQQFILNVLQEAGSRGIKLIFSPFDTFSYDEQFGLEGPWASNFGGPLTDINNFFQTPGTLAMAKQRMGTLINWVNASPYASSLIGWEPVNEWDSYEWTLNAEGNADPGRETEMRRRAVWIDDLALYTKQHDPNHLVLNATIVRDPRGPLAREIFYSRTFDALVPHLYTNGNDGPLLNPQADKSVLAAQEAGYFTSYWITHRQSNMPVLSGEWGMTRAHWPGGVPSYQAGYTQAQDEELYRVVTWASFASGQAGVPLRISTEELLWNLGNLSPAMRDTQLAFSRFVNSTSLGGAGLDFSHYSLRSLAGKVSATATGKSLLAWAVSDGGQGVAYVLQNGNLSAGTVSGATLSVGGFDLDRIVDAEVWSTLPGTTAPLATISGLYTGSGTVDFALPNFTKDIAVKFKARPRAGSVQPIESIAFNGSLVTFSLGADGQPVATIVNASTGAVTVQDVAAAANFRGRVRDMTPYAYPAGTLNLAVTDADAHVWLLSGNPTTGVWSSTDLTATTAGFTISGDLTSFLPSWDAVHLVGLDARGHVAGFWWVWDSPTWKYDDMTGRLGFPTLDGGLSSWIAPGWNGLNIGGIKDGELIAYYWAPDRGPGNWSWDNLTVAVENNGVDSSTRSERLLIGQLDALTSPRNELILAGVTTSGRLAEFRWTAPAPGQQAFWRYTDLSSAAGLPNVVPGAEAVVASDGQISYFGFDASQHVWRATWNPSTSSWSGQDVTAAAGGIPTTSPMATSATGNRLIFASRNATPQKNLILYSFFLPTATWQTIGTPQLAIS